MVLASRSQRGVDNKKDGRKEFDNWEEEEAGKKKDDNNAHPVVWTVLTSLVVIIVSHL